MRISDWSSDVCSSDLSFHSVHWLRPSCKTPSAPFAGARGFFAASAALFFLLRHLPKGGEVIATQTGSHISNKLEGMPRYSAFVASDRETSRQGRSNKRLDRTEEHTSELQSLMRHYYS